MTNESANIAELVDQMAKFLDLPIDADYRPGVIANLERTATIARLVIEFPLPDSVEVAPTFQP